VLQPESTPAFLKLLSAVIRQLVRFGSPNAFERKIIVNIVSYTWRMKKTPIRVCAKTAFVGWPSVESMWIPSSFHNFLSYNIYFRKCFKLVHMWNVVMVTLTTGILFLLFTCTHFWARGFFFTTVVRVCADRLWSGPRLPKVWETLICTYNKNRCEDDSLLGYRAM
jgi:hypothetical protein